MPCKVVNAQLPFNFQCKVVESYARSTISTCYEQWNVGRPYMCVCIFAIIILVLTVKEYLEPVTEKS